MCGSTREVSRKGRSRASGLTSDRLIELATESVTVIVLFASLTPVCHPLTSLEFLAAGFQLISLAFAASFSTSVATYYIHQS